MSYIVTRTVSNGYRCGCCIQSWSDDPLWVDDLEVALSYVPTRFQRDPDLDVLEVAVREGSSGKVIAEGKLEYPSGFERGCGYRFSRWSGFTPDGPFEDIQGQEGVEQTQTWTEILGSMRQEYAQKKLDEAKAQYEAAARSVEAVKRSVEKSGS